MFLKLLWRIFSNRFSSMRNIHTYPEINPFNDKTDGRVIGWWSGGVASAVACTLALDKYKDAVELVFCDTNLEHPDTYRFMSDFEKTLGVKIKTIKSERFNEPEEVWRKYKGLNFAHGAPCSMTMKKEPRIKYQKLNEDFAQIFGFDYCKKEERRATSMLVNNPDLNPIFPLIIEKYDRQKIFDTIKHLGLIHPITYNHFLNNNCIGDFASPKGGCIQGGVGYWKKIKDLFPHKYEYMANLEHEISRSKGSPVTICRDKNGNKIFLKKNPDFPEVETVDIVKGRTPITMFECNGFCSTQSV